MSFLEDIRPHLRAVWTRTLQEVPGPSETDALPAPARRALIAVAVLAVTFLALLPLWLLLRQAFSQGPFALAFALADPEAWHAVRRALLLAPPALLLNVLFGAGAAWVLARHRFPGRTLLAALVDGPLALSPATVGLLLLILFGRQGYLRWVTDTFHLHIVFSWPGALLALIFLSTPLVTRQLLTALQSTPPAPDDADAPPREVLRRLTAPPFRWALVYGAALAWARCLGEFGALTVLAGALGGPGDTPALFLLRALSAPHAPAVGGICLFLAALSALFTLISEYVLRRPRPARKLSRPRRR